MRHEDIPAPTVERLSLYLRHLELLGGRGVQTVSSKAMGRELGLTEAQVRKDLGHVGTLGTPGAGYRVDDLVQRFRRVLGVDQTRNGVLVGVGRLGSALAGYRGFARKGLRLVAAVDSDPQVIGRKVGPQDEIEVRAVRELEDIVRKLDVRLAVLCVPAAVAQELAERLVDAGVCGILNFAPVGLKVPKGVAVRGVDLAVQLEQLSFQVNGLLEREDR